PRARRDVCLDAQDGVDPGRSTCLVELERSEHRPVIGHRPAPPPEPPGPLEQGADPGCPVEQRVLGMRVQVDEATSRHAPLATSSTEPPDAGSTTFAFAFQNLQTCNSPPANSILPRPAVKRRGGRPEALVQQHLDLRDMP